MLSFVLVCCLTSCQTIVGERVGASGRSGASEFEGRLYKVFVADLSWHEAEKQCIEMGGMLASVKSAAANDFMIELIGKHCVWLGGSDEVKEGEWFWRDGSRMIYHNWAKHEPDNWYDGKEHWLVAGWYPDGTWGDTQGYFRKPVDGFVCEWVE